MRRLRSIPALVCTLVLAATPAVALAQSAGDEQYQDPFGSETTPSSQSDGTTTDSGGNLTTEPQVSPGSSTPSTPSSTAPQTTDVPQVGGARSGELPDTGIDTRLFLALGASLLLAGVGLRLRTIPERF
ncbi:LPXTG cell wall anchor domain-containing protein [Paraconexibacter sp.]|uniref:LPXTG cell wall anchor domain-containing protein n=1 Tax=Paraconexibacter sp. TaxID=2949640 RepID=UPI00356A2FFA